MLKIDLSKTSKELLYALLTETAGKTITEADVSYGNITAIDGANSGEPNTTVDLSSVEGSTVVKPGGVEPLTRQLTRYDLTAVATALGVNLNISDDITQYDTPAFVVAKVNSLFGSVLTESELLVTPAAAVDGVRSVVVTVVEGEHIALYGSATLTVTDNVDHRETVADTFPNPALSGFDSPTAA